MHFLHMIVLKDEVSIEEQVHNYMEPYKREKWNEYEITGSLKIADWLALPPTERYSIKERKKVLRPGQIIGTSLQSSEMVWREADQESSRKEWAEFVFTFLQKHLDWTLVFIDMHI